MSPWRSVDGQRVIGRTSTTEMLTGIKGGGGLEKYLGVEALKPFINLDNVLERAASCVVRVDHYQTTGELALKRLPPPPRPPPDPLWILAVLEVENHLRRR